MSDQKTSQLKKGVIRINIADERELYQLYMPYVDGCGLFYPTADKYELEQEVFVFLQLPKELGKFAVSGRIVWLNPPKTKMKQEPGVGIQLRGREAPKIRETIEQGLGKMLTTGLPTMTM